MNQEAMANAVAAELAISGELWVAKDRGKLQRDDGLALHCREDWKTHRVKVGLWLDPEEYRILSYQGDKFPKTITLASGRPAIEIAREIRRRLLPEASRVYTLVRARLEAEASRAQRITSHTVRYAALVGSSPGDSSKGVVTLPYTDEAHGDFTVDSDGSIRLDVALDAETAEAVLQCLAGRQRLGAEKAEGR